MRAPFSPRSGFGKLYLLPFFPCFQANGWSHPPLTTFTFFCLLHAFSFLFAPRYPSCVLRLNLHVTVFISFSQMPLPLLELISFTPSKGCINIGLCRFHRLPHFFAQLCNTYQMWVFVFEHPRDRFL